MNRKSFLSAFGLISAGATVNGYAAEGLSVSSKQRRPPYLKEGDTVGISSPAGYISIEEIQPAKMLMESWGLKVLIGRTIGKRAFTFGGTDEERRSDFQDMLDNPIVMAIMCARGGYGMVRIIDKLDFHALKKKPKWVIGFSDITVLHSHLNSKLNLPSIHSKMCNSFPDDWLQADSIQVETILSIKDALMGATMKYEAPYVFQNRMGSTRGQLVGGNLSILENLSGTASAAKTKGKILFLEDTGEYLYSVDRMLWNLKRTGILDDLAGLIIGNFKTKADDPEETFGRSIVEMVLEKIEGLTYPVCFEFPVGHQRSNFALRCGIEHELKISANGTSLVSLN